MQLHTHNKWMVALLWATILAYFLTIPLAAVKNGRFIHLWVAGRTIATGQSDQLYDPPHYAILEQTKTLDADQYWGERYDTLGVFFYPPFAGLFYAPFGFYTPTIAQAIHALLTILLTAVSTYLLYHITGRRLNWVTIALFLFLYPATFYNFVLGQNGQLTLTLVLTSWYFLRHHQPTTAGGFLALLAYKPNWLLALAWFPLIQKRWRVCLGLLIGGLLLTFTTALLLGLDSFFDYVNQFWHIANLHEEAGYPLTSQYSTLALFRRYLGLTPTAELIGWIVTLSIWAITVWLIAPIKEIDNPQFLKATALAWTTAVLLNPHLHHYDLPLTAAALIIPLIDWPRMVASKRALFILLALFHHLAFVLTDTLDISHILPLPTFAAFAVWLWFAYTIYMKTDQTTRHKGVQNK